MPQFTFSADDLDAAAIHQAVAALQASRIDGEHVLPEHDSDTIGACLAEIARDWLEHRGQWPGVNSAEGEQD